MTLKELYERSCSQYSDRIAISFVNGEPMTYAYVKKEIDRITELVTRLGIRKGDRVAILSGNMPNWCITYFAITGTGAIAVPILPDFHPEEIQSILQHSGSKAIFVSTKLQHKIENLQIEDITHQILIEDFSILSGELIDKPLPAEQPENNDTAVIIYTSGTTGRSKGVMLSHHNITIDAEMCLCLQDVNLNDVFLSILPLSHAYEKTISFILPFMMGASIYYLEKPPTASVLIPALKKIRPTTMLSVPLVIEKIYRNQILAKFTRTKPVRLLYEKVTPFRKTMHYLAGVKLRKTFGGRMRFFGVGGAKLDAVVERFLIEARFPYAIGYGLTETAPMVAGANPSKTRYQCIGQVMTGIEVKIDEPNPKTGVGEILVKGENVMQGYYRDEEATKSVFTDDGFFRTGDLGCFDNEKCLYIKGRLKNMILGASGENIYPEDIESVINNVQGVMESLVLEKKGKLVAMVCLNMEELEKNFHQMRSYINDKKEEWGKHKEEWNEHIETFLEELQEYVNNRVSRFSQIHSVIVVPTPFEKTPTQKIKRYLYY